MFKCCFVWTSFDCKSIAQQLTMHFSAGVHVSHGGLFVRPHSDRARMSDQLLCDLILTKCNSTKCYTAK